MGDRYDIYIHSDQASSIADNTKPKEHSLNGAFKPKKISKELEEVLNPGAASLSKVGAALGVGLAGAKVVDNVLVTGFGHIAEYCGSFKYSMALNNFNTAISHITNPIGYVKQILHREFQWNKQNQAVEQQSLLIGQTVFSNRKIGL